MVDVTCDLNVPVDDADPSEIAEKVKQLINFGYQVIALNKIHTISKKRKRDGKKKSSYAHEPEPPSVTTQKVLSMLETKPDNFKILSRITVVLENNDDVRELQSDYIKSFDLVAVRPMNERLFHQVCIQVDLADIISLDLDSRLQFKLKFTSLGAAVKRGLFIEISYASSIRSSALRQSVLANGMNLVTRSRGRGIILSSGAEHFMEIRGPYDIINLGLLFGLNEKNSKEAITKNCKDVIVHAFSRNHTAKSVISMRKVGEPLSTIESIVKMSSSSVLKTTEVFTEEPLIKRQKHSENL